MRKLNHSHVDGNRFHAEHLFGASPRLNVDGNFELSVVSGESHAVVNSWNDLLRHGDEPSEFSVLVGSIGFSGHSLGLLEVFILVELK